MIQRRRLLSRPEVTESNIDQRNLEAWDLMIHDPVKALELSTEIYEDAVKLNYQQGIAESLLNLGWCRKYTSQLEVSLYNLMDALSVYQNIGDSGGTAKALNAVGAVYFDLGNFDSALDFFSKSLERSREIGDTRREIAALNNIGEVYREQKNTEEALRYYFAGLALAEKLEDPETMGNLLLGAGIVYTNTENCDRAVEYITRALTCSEKISDNITRAHCLTNLGNIYQKKGDCQRSEELYKESLEISRSTGNLREEAEILVQMGELREDTGDNEDALEYYERALKTGREIKAKPVVLLCLGAISRIYEGRGDYSTALRRFKEFYELESEFTQDETEKRFQKLAVRYEIEKSRRETEIFRQKNEELARASEELKMANHRISLISEIGKQITGTLKLDDLLTQVYREVKHLMPADSLGLAHYIPDSSTINFLFFIEGTTRFKPFTINLDDRDSLGAWCIRRKEEIFINDPDWDSLKYIRQQRKHVVGSPSGSIIYVPLFYETSILGLITVQALEKHSYTTEHLDILRSLGSYISIALYNSLAHEEIKKLNTLVMNEKAELEKAYEKISHMAHHDNLTGLPNRRLLLEFLQKAVAQAVRQEEKLGVLYIDLDNFKPVNDTLGHAAGDMLLRLVADRFLSAFRRSDTIARIGGDEFAAVIVGVRSEEALEAVLEKIHQAMEEPFVIQDRDFNIGVSIGTSLFPDDGKTPDELLMVADKKMYLNKISDKKHRKYRAG